MSVTADNLVQFVMQNQDQDPLVKKCFQISTRGVHFWCRKVFEGVQIHVFNLIRKHSFGAEY